MKNWLSLTGLLLLLSVLGYSQDGQSSDEFREAIIWSETFDLAKNVKLREVITLRDGSASILGAGTEGLIHFKFGKDGSFLGKETLLGIASSLYGYIVQGDSLFIVHSIFEENQQVISIHLFNLASPTSADPEANFVARFIGSRKGPKRLVWSISPSGRYWMVSQQAAFSREKGSALNFQTFDLATGDSMAYQLALPYKSDDFEYLDGLVSDSGSLFFTGKTGVKLNSPFRRKYLMFSYAHGTRELREYNVNPEDLFLQQIDIRPAADGVLALALYSSDPFADNETSGYLLSKYNAVGDEIKSKYIQAYSQGEVEQNQMAGSMGSESSIEDFFLQDMVEANAWYALFEKRFLDQVCSTDPRTGIMDCTDQYNYLGLTVVNLAQPGKSVYVPRRQLDFNAPGPYISNLSIPIDDKLLVLYNDHFKNEGAEEDRIMNNVNRSAIRAVIIGPDLKSSSLRLTQERQNDFAFMSKVPCTPQKDGVYILSSDNREFRLGYLSFDALTQ